MHPITIVSLIVWFVLNAITNFGLGAVSPLLIGVVDVVVIVALCFTAYSHRHTV